MNKTTEALKLAEEALLGWMDAFDRHAYDIDIKALAAIREALDHSGDANETSFERKEPDSLRAEQVERKWPLMGYGNVSIGGCKQPDGTSGLIYLDMGETREIGADTTDLFPAGSEADPSKLLACIYFKDGSAIQQTIDVLHEMKIEIEYAAPVSAKRELVELTDDELKAALEVHQVGLSVRIGRIAIAAFKEKNK